ncbi:MAG TPA: SDR family oxidoreductase [Vicinamibacterales bacterium]|jgi:NAD(P)-dependent dehydrogenase (short-subunit alcohol dehydrogenase family)
MDLGLKGKRAIVTGATRGIGRRIAERLLLEGASVAICARKQDEVDEAVRSIATRGTTVWGRKCDVANGDEYVGWMEEAIGTLGGVDIFVPNVTAGGGLAPIEQWRANFEVDVLGTVRGCEAVIPKMTAGGAIVAIGSTAAVETFMGANAYNAMKAALITYTKQLSQAVGAQGIRVNLVSPGPIEFAGGAWDKIRQARPEFYERIRILQPTGRMGKPEEVADAVAFLASDRASWITGVNLIVDGGFTKRVAF